MAHSLSAKKRIRQTEKRNARNRTRKEQVKVQVKSFNAAITGGDVAKAEVELQKAVSKIDKIAAKHTIHKKTAARRRSRMTKKLNVAKAAKPAAAA